jgi:hypothetical protein
LKERNQDNLKLGKNSSLVKDKFNNVCARAHGLVSKVYRSNKCYCKPADKTVTRK